MPRKLLLPVSFNTLRISKSLIRLRLREARRNAQGKPPAPKPQRKDSAIPYPVVNFKADGHQLWRLLDYILDSIQQEIVRIVAVPLSMPYLTTVRTPIYVICKGKGGLAPPLSGTSYTGGESP